MKLMAYLTERNGLVLSCEPSLNAHILIFVFFSSVCYVFVLFCSVLVSFNFPSLFLFHLIAENLVLLIFLVIMIIIPCSGMFLDVPECFMFLDLSTAQFNNNTCNKSPESQMQNLK